MPPNPLPCLGPVLEEEPFLLGFPGTGYSTRRFLRPLPLAQEINSASCYSCKSSIQKRQHEPSCTVLRTPTTFPTGQMGGGLPHHLYFNPRQSLVHIEKLWTAVG